MAKPTNQSSQPTNQPTNRPTNQPIRKTTCSLHSAIWIPGFDRLGVGRCKVGHRVQGDAGRSGMVKERERGRRMRFAGVSRGQERISMVVMAGGQFDFKR